MAALFLIITLPHRRRRRRRLVAVIIIIIIIIVVIVIIIIIIIMQSLLRQVHSLFQCEFYKEYATSCILLQYLVSLRSSNRCLPLVHRLSVPSIPPSI
jgi:predicted PurR-regulated permease PerM